MKNNNKPKILSIAMHGSAIRRYLWGLNVYDNRNVFENAEMSTLEIYSANPYNGLNDYGNIKYLFRWTREGEFIPYPPCNHIYDTKNTQLCDLEIMLQNDFNDAMPIQDFNKEICPFAMSKCLCDIC